MSTDTDQQAMAVTPDKAQWERIEKYLRERLFPVVKFRVGEHEIVIEKQPVAENRQALFVFIDGSIKGEWMVRPENVPSIALSVWRKRTIALYKPKEKARLISKLGKGRAREFFPGLDAETVSYTPEFGTANSLVRQFKKIKGLKLVEMGCSGS